MILILLNFWTCADDLEVFNGLYVIMTASHTFMSRAIVVDRSRQLLEQIWESVLVQKVP